MYLSRQLTAQNIQNLKNIGFSNARNNCSTALNNWTNNSNIVIYLIIFSFYYTSIAKFNLSHILQVTAFLQMQEYRTSKCLCAFDFLFLQVVIRKTIWLNHLLHKQLVHQQSLLLLRNLVIQLFWFHSNGEL